MAEIAQLRRVDEHETWTHAGPVNSHLEDSELQQLEERSIATIAEPAALGLWGFATGTWIAGAAIAGWLPSAALVAIAPVLLVFAGLTQFIAGLIAFRRANTMAGTAFCAFGAFNVTAAFTFLLQATGMLPHAGYAAVVQGDLLISFGFIAFALTIAALKLNRALVATLGTLAIGYVGAAIPQLADAVGAPGWSIVSAIGGTFLIISAICAFYTGTAMVVNSTWKRAVLPLGGKA